MKLLAVLLISLIPVSACQPKNSSTSKTPFGIVLQPAAANLLEHVENKFQKGLREGTYVDTGPSNWADAKVDDDGAPLIRLNTTTPPSEAIIVHELFHLKLRAEGYPESWHFNMPDQENTDDNERALSLVIRELYFAIEHWIFYPEMRKMKIDPNVEFSAEFEQTRKKPGFFYVARPPKQGGAFYYLKAALQFDDPKRLETVIKWYESNGWNESLELGQQLTKQVIDNNPGTPESAVTTFMDCLNLIYRGMFVFSFEGWKSQKKGNLDFKIAVIRMKPATP